MSINNSKHIKTTSAGGVDSWLKKLGLSGQERPPELFLYLGPQAPGKVSWAEKKPGRRFRISSGSLEDFSKSTELAPIILVPGSEVLLTKVEVPHGNRARAAKSIPFLIEENLAEDVETLHFAMGRVNPAGKTPVAVVSRKKMAGWQAMLSEAGVEVGNIVPASLCVPSGKGKWAIVADGREWLVGRDGSVPFAVDPENCQMILGLAEGSDLEGGPLGVVMYTEESENQNLSQLLPNREIEMVTSPFMEVMADGYVQESAINLVQGDFGRSAEWRGLWGKWQFFIWSVFVLLLLGTVSFSLDYSKLSATEKRLDAEMQSVFKAAFPGSKRFDNPRMRMESKLKALGAKESGRDVFFKIYDQVVSIMLQSPGFSLANLRFKDGRFDFDLELASLQALDNLKEALGENEEIRIEIKNASASGNKVRAIIQVTASK